MKWCIIGAGGIADRRTIPALLKDPDNQLVALMDRRLDVAKTLGEKYGVKYFDNPDAMLSQVDCDAVYIGTPVACHYDQAMTVLKYDKHLFIEKPVALNSKTAKKIVDAFKKKGKQIMVGYMMKYHNLHQKAKQLIANGEIGQVVDVRAQFSCWYPDIKGAWRQNKKLGGGGALMDLSVHCIELIEDILGDEIEQVKSFYSTRTFSYEVEDCGVFIFKTKGGVLGHIDCNFNIPDNASLSKLEIYGEKGYTICEGTLGQEEKGKLYHLYSPQGDYSAKQERVTDKPTEYDGGNADLYLKQLQVFANQIKSGKLDYFYADRAVQVQKVIDKIYKQKQK